MTVGQLLNDCWSALNAKANENDSHLHYQGQLGIHRVYSEYS